jgi:hypothetical protein
MYAIHADLPYGPRSLVEYVTRIRAPVHPALRAGLVAHHRGFEVLDQGAELDLRVIFGVASHVYPDPGERIFVRRQRP